MYDYPCIKIYQFNYLIKKLKKVKSTIRKCENDRFKIIENVEISKIEKKNLTKSLDKKLSLVKNKYVIIHNNFYELINEVMKYECCTNINRECKKDVLCMKKEDNDRVLKSISDLNNKIVNFSKEVETYLVIENELCLHRINKIKKIKFFEY